jgi:hypothetical protein
MKVFTVPRLAFLAALTVLFFCACSTESDDDDGGAEININLPIDGTGGRHYYSLSSGTEVSSPSGGNWDIALEAHDGAFFVLTNSGVTAGETSPASSGLGGVWFTNSTSFSAVTTAAQAVLPAAGNEYEPYTVDCTRYVMAMAAEPVQQTLNVITYLGYPDSDNPDHDGSSAANYLNRTDPDMSNLAAYVPYLFNKRQAYTMRGMPPSYTPTMRVYIVRHGDGVSCSKVQMSEAYREPGEPSLFVLRLKYEPVN